MQSRYLFVNAVAVLLIYAVYTLTAVLAVLMLSPLYDVMRMAQAAKATEMTSPVGLPAGSLAAQTQAATLQADEGLQARTQLNLLLTSGVIAALHFMRLLGSTLAECNRLTSLEEDMKVSAKQPASVGVEDQGEVPQEGEGSDKVVVGEGVAGAQKGLKEE